MRKTRYVCFVLAGFLVLLPDASAAPVLRLSGQPAKYVLPPQPKSAAAPCVLEFSGISARRPPGITYSISVQAEGRIEAIGTLSFYDIAGIAGAAEPLRFALPVHFCAPGKRLTIFLRPSHGRFVSAAQPRITDITIKY
jgi:hypothetical protein